MKIIYTLVALLLTFTSAHSQSFDFGAKIGFPVSSIRITDQPQAHISADKPEIWRHFFESKVGFNISALAGYNLSPKIHLGIEPGYIIKGANFDGSDSKLSLHYLNFPVILKFRVSNHIGVLAGPEFSTLLKATLDFDGDNIDMKDFYDDVNEISLNIGVEYLATEKFGFGFRYNHGLTKVSETVWTDELGEIDSICKENNSYILLYSTIHL